MSAHGFFDKSIKQNTDKLYLPENVTFAAKFTKEIFFITIRMMSIYREEKN